MKKFISKIRRNKRLKGNISLLIIFILLAGSVIALLSINQIQRLLEYGNMTFNYFRSFYLAKAGTELGLTEVYYREAWFNQSISSWDAIVANNLVWIYSGFNPYFEMEIEWNFKYLTNDVRYTDKCDDENRIVLWAWEWIMISLFRDETSGFDEILSNKTIVKKLDDEDIQKIWTTNLSWEWGWDEKFTLWLFSYDNGWNMNNIIVEEKDNLNSFLNNKIKSIPWDRRYLTIKNPGTWNEIAKFCINMWWNYLVPDSDSLVTVRANYADMEVWLQSVVKKSAPSWALNVLWWM